MISEILAFTFLIVMVFGGMAVAVIRFLSTGKVSARADYRVSREEISEEDKKNMEDEKNDSHNNHIKMPHVMA